MMSNFSFEILSNIKVKLPKTAKTETAKFGDIIEIILNIMG